MKKSLFFALIACATLVFVGCEPKVQPTDYTVKLSATELTLENGASEKLTAVVTPNSTYTLVWTSSNDSVVTVNASGIVEAVGLGTATITVTLNTPAEDPAVGSVTPATCVVNVTNDAVLNTFELGGFTVWAPLGQPIEGTDTVFQISTGESVLCQLAPTLYRAWDNNLVFNGSTLVGAGYVMDLQAYGYMIVDGPYAGYSVFTGELYVDTIAADEVVAVTAPAGELIDVDKYGDAWTQILSADENTTEEEANAIMDLYYASQTGSQFYYADYTKGSYSYNCGNVSYLAIIETKEGVFYNLKLEWYDDVNENRFYGLLVETEVNEEDGLLYVTGIVEPYDMRVINKQYQVLPPVTDEEGVEEPAETKAYRIVKPVVSNADQASFIKDMTRMYKK